MKVLSIAPSRISLFGGGTDLPIFYEQYGGLVINFGINLRHQTLMYSGDHLFERAGLSVFPSGSNPDFYLELLEKFNIRDLLHLTALDCTFDGIIESGLGSSATAIVSLLGAINRRLDFNWTLDEIAELAWDHEVNKLGLYGGKQDQYAAAYGGVNVIEFKDKVVVTPLARGFLEPLIPSLVLLYTGYRRKSSDIQKGFKKLTQAQINYLQEMKALVLEAVDKVAKGNFKEVGKLLDITWDLKKHANPLATNSDIDFLYEKGRRFGALGGKVLGAGGGGFMLFIVDPEKKQDFIKKMELEWFDFGVDFNGLEVRILE